MITYDELAPDPALGLEANIVRQLEELVSGLPAGTAQLRIGRVPGHPEWPHPSFWLSPANPKAAPLAGVAVDGDVDVTIGRAFSRRELFWQGGNIAKGANCEEEFAWICEAVIRGEFTEIQYYNSRGRLVGSKGKLLVKGIELAFGDGRWLPVPFLKREKRIVHYEPYLPPSGIKGVAEI